MFLIEERLDISPGTLLIEERLNVSTRIARINANEFQYVSRRSHAFFW